MANYTTKQISKRLGVSIRTVQRRVNKHNWERIEQTQQPNNATKDDKNDIGATNKFTPTITGPFDPDALLQGLCIQGNPTALNIFFNRFYDDHKSQSKNQYSHYTRPDWLYPHQKDMVDLMRKGNIFIIGARQLTGKTTGTHIAGLEEMIETDACQIKMVTPSMPLSREMVGKIMSDKLLHPLYEPYLLTNLVESLTLKNKSKIGILPCKPNAVQGHTSNILWLEEIDKTIEDKIGRRTLAGAFPQVIKKMLDGEGKVWATCNMGTTRAFKFFKNAVMKLGGEFFPVCEIIEPTVKGSIRELVVLNENIPTPPQLLNDREGFLKNFMYEILLALTDEQFAKAMILNIEDFSHEMLQPDLIQYAFDSYDKDKIPEFLAMVVEGVDPGYGHGTGVIILGLDTNGHVHELFAKKYFGGEISENDLKQEVHDKYLEFSCWEGACESAYGGLFWIDEWREKGLNFWSANFGTANPKTGEVGNQSKAIERSYKERVLKDLLEKKRIHLHNKTLWNEFSLYNPLEDKEKGKGDLIDALLHALFILMGGVNYVVNEIMQEQGGEEDSGAMVG